MKFYLIISTFLISSIPSYGQIIDDFKVSVANGKVFLNWTIKTGNICQGVIVERSSDSLNFMGIGSIPGVCGSLSEPISYTFIDSNPGLLGKYYYRLNLNSFGESDIVSILVRNNSTHPFSVFPNPSHGNITIFSNGGKNPVDSFTICIYSLNSVRLIDKRYFSGRQVNFNLSLKPGLYFYSILNQHSAFDSGLLLIQ